MKYVLITLFVLGSFISKAQILDDCEDPKECLKTLLSNYQQSPSNYDELKGVIYSASPENTNYY
jgi:hypothetical protein